MSVVQKLIHIAATHQGAEREQALLLLDLTKFAAGPLAEKMEINRTDLGFSASDNAHLAPYLATKQALALEEAAKIVVAKFAVPGLTAGLGEG